MDIVSVRYIVDDVDEAIIFYRDHLGFELVRHPAPGFAMPSAPASSPARVETRR